MGKAAAGGKVHGDGQPADGGVEAHLLDRPRGRNPQRLLEQPFRAQHRLPPRPSPLNRRTRPGSSVSSVVPRQGCGCARPAAALDPFSRPSLPTRNSKEALFLTNNTALPALTIAALYKSRWQVELFFDVATQCTSAYVNE